jgi:hypothetical protein
MPADRARSTQFAAARAAGTPASTHTLSRQSELPSVRFFASALQTRNPDSHSSSRISNSSSGRNVTSTGD